MIKRSKGTIEIVSVIDPIKDLRAEYIALGCTYTDASVYAAIDLLSARKPKRRRSRRRG
jgi:hypothetical protein